MSSITVRFGKAALLGVVSLAGLAGCSRVTPDQLQTELTALRSEMAEGDSALSSRIAANDQRITDMSTRLDSLERDLQALRTEFNASVQRMETALRFNVPVHFAFNDATVRETDQALLDRFAKVVGSSYSNAHITIEGFADPAGSAAYNQELGLNRAESVRDYLVTSGGLNAGMLHTVSYGEARNRQVVPGAYGPGDRGLENRRVAFVIDFAGEGNMQTTASR
jgi:peptidoglycan-associated lipoprotein